MPNKQLPIELTLYENCLVAEDSPLMRVTNKLGKTWRRSIRSNGGFWMGEAEFEGSVAEMDDMFRDGLMWELRETWGGYLTWQGFLAEMAYTRNGVKYVKSWRDVYNKVSMSYTQSSAQLITNGSGESGAWSAVSNGTSPTISQSTVWKTHGNYSVKIESNGDLYAGAEVQSDIAIVAGTDYKLRLNYKWVSGYWQIIMYQSTNRLVYSTISSYSPGEGTVEIEFNSGDVVGKAYLRIQCATEVAADAIYIDNVTLRGGTADADTGWTSETDSQARYGVKEYVIDKGTMSEDAAAAMVTSELRKYAYPTIKAPMSLTLDPDKKDNKLELIFYGYALTLANKYSNVSSAFDTDIATCSELITDEVANSEYITAGDIETNATSFEMDNVAEKNTQWNVIQSVANTGDSDGDRWEVGVLGERKLYYREVAETIKGRIRRGIVCDSVGAPMEPWLCEPGYYLIEDMPIDYQHMSGYSARNERWVYFDEVEFNAAEWHSGKQGLAFYQITYI